MQRNVRLGLAVTFLALTILVPEALVSPTSKTHHPIHSSNNVASVEGPHNWTDALSGGVWARLNDLQNGSVILDPAQAQAKLGLPTASLSAASSASSPFSNNNRVTGNYGLFPEEDEPSIVVRNQTGQFLMVVGANSLGSNHMVSYVSTDQGSHWIGPSYLPFSRGNDSFASDPGLGVDRSGTFYYSFLSINNNFFFSQPTGQDDLVVATSADGVHWTNHVAVQRRISLNNSTIRGELFDKPYLAVGPSFGSPSLDSVYVTYTDFVNYCSNQFPFTCGENSTIMEVHSVDSGTTWSKPLPVSPSVSTTTNFFGPAGRLVQGSMPAVGPNGYVYVGYYDSGKDGWLNASASVMISRSLDGGVSFSHPTQAAIIPQQLTYFSNNCCFRWWSSMFPSMDVAPDGTVYISYGARQGAYSPDPADVYLVASIDNGVTWSQPNKINDDQGQSGQFFSWLKVSSDGAVHIIWGDQRLDPTGLGYDIFYAVATNHGSTISTNVRVTDVGTDPQFEFFAGDYFNLAVSGSQVYPVWTDARRGLRPFGRYFFFGETDIFTAKLGPRDTPSIVASSAPPAGYTSPITVTGSGLPRETFFTLRMNGTELISQTSGLLFFFSDASGHSSDVVLLNSDSPGSYTLTLSEWVSGSQLATATSYIIQSRSTSLSVTCSPSQVAVNDLTTCVATVTDIAPINPIVPTGEISWTTNGAGSFSVQTCNLSGSGTSSTCSVNYTPKSSGPVLITASFSGGNNQPLAFQSTTLTVNSSQNNTANNPQATPTSMLFIAALAGGAGLIGAVVGVGATLVLRKRGSSSSSSSSAPEAQRPELSTAQQASPFFQVI